MVVTSRNKPAGLGAERLNGAPARTEPPPRRIAIGRLPSQPADAPNEVARARTVVDEKPRPQGSIAAFCTLEVFGILKGELIAHAELPKGRGETDDA